MTGFQRWWLTHIAAAVCGVTLVGVLLFFLEWRVSWLPFTLIPWQALLLVGIPAGGMGGALTYFVAQKLLRLRIEARALLGWMGLGALLWPLVLAAAMVALVLTWPVTFFIPDITIPGWRVFQDGPLVAAFLVGNLSAGVLTGSALAFLRARARHAYVRLED